MNVGIELRMSERNKHIVARIVVALEQFGEAFKAMANALKERQGFMELLELIGEYDEQPLKTKPLRLRDLPKALPMRHQVMNRKPAMQVARSRC